MGAKFLTNKTLVQCPHGGLGDVPDPQNKWVAIEGELILVETDTHGVAGCSEKAPCTSITWKEPGVAAGSSRSLVTIDGAGVLTTKSKGTTNTGLKAKIDADSAAAPSQGFVTGE